MGEGHGASCPTAMGAEPEPVRYSTAPSATVGYAVGRLVGFPVYMSGFVVYIFVLPLSLVNEVILLLFNIIMFIPRLIFRALWMCFFNIIMFIPRLIFRVLWMCFGYVSWLVALICFLFAFVVMWPSAPALILSYL